MDDWEVTIVRTFKEIEAIRDIWDQMQHNESSAQINADIDRYLSVISSAKDKVQPYVMLLNYNGTSKAMIIGQIEKSSINISIGYKILFHPKLKCLSVVYGGILGVNTTDVCAVIIQKIMDTLTQEKVDVIRINYLDTDSTFYRLARKTPHLLCRTYFPKIEHHSGMTIPEKIDLLYQTLAPKTRNTIRRKIKKPEREFADQIKIVTYRDKDQLHEAISTACEISKNTYHAGLNAGLINEPKTYKIMSTAAKHNWLRMSILYIKGEPCAFQLGLQYGKTYFLEQLGFHPRWKQWNVGTFLFFKVLEDLCLDSTVEKFNFGFGDAQYKRSYGDESWDEASVYIFAPRFYPICVNMLRTCVAALNSGLRYATNKSGLTNRIKRLWRNRLEKNNS